MAVVVTEETRTALGLKTRLPALPELVTRAGIEESHGSAADLWTSSWDVVDRSGEDLRETAYRTVAPSLAESLGTDGALGALSEVGEAVRAASTMDPEGLTPAMVENIDRARRLHDAGFEALDRGEVDVAFRYALEASDELREIGPSAMARNLIARASRVLEEMREEMDGPPRPGEDEVFIRADRLVGGARRALEEGDWSRAVRRAYYASQILGISPG